MKAKQIKYVLKIMRVEPQPQFRVLQGVALKDLMLS